MSTTVTREGELPELPLTAWEETKETLHRWVQIVARDPRAVLLSFLESAYEAGATLAGWDRDELASSWCPAPPELDELLAGS